MPGTREPWSGGTIPVYEPYFPPVQPDPAVPTSTPDGADNGSRELSAPNDACVTVIGPRGMPAVACVVVPGKRGELKPDPGAIPLPPPGWDWCAHGSICNATIGLPPDWRDKICLSKYTVDAANCLHDYNTGKKSLDQANQCVELKYTDLMKCRSQVGKLTSPAIR